jgi:hypothetical protein
MTRQPTLSAPLNDIGESRYVRSRLDQLERRMLAKGNLDQKDSQSNLVKSYLSQLISQIQFGSAQDDRETCSPSIPSEAEWEQRGPEVAPSPKDPTVPLVASSPNFPSAHFAFDIHIVPGLAALPTPASSTIVATESLPVMSTAAPIFDGIVADLGKQGKSIDPSPPGAGRTPPASGPRLPSVLVRKYLPLSYQQVVGYVPRPKGRRFD